MTAKNLDAFDRIDRSYAVQLEPQDDLVSQEFSTVLRYLIPLLRKARETSLYCAGSFVRRQDN